MLRYDIGVHTNVNVRQVSVTHKSDEIADVGTETAFVIFFKFTEMLDIFFNDTPTYVIDKQLFCQNRYEKYFLQFWLRVGQLN